MDPWSGVCWWNVCIPQALKKQLEGERREQKKLLEVLTNVIKGEVPCVSLDKAENILVIFQYSSYLLSFTRFYSGGSAIARCTSYSGEQWD